MLKLGDPVRYRGRTFVVAGFRPRSQGDDRILLEHVLSLEQVWAEPGEIDQLEDEAERSTPRGLGVYGRLRKTA